MSVEYVGNNWDKHIYRVKIACNIVSSLSVLYSETATTILVPSTYAQTKDTNLSERIQFGEKIEF